MLVGRSEERKRNERTRYDGVEAEAVVDIVPGRWEAAVEEAVADGALELLNGRDEK